MICSRPHRMALVGAFWLCGALQVLAASASLTRLVPADAGVCLTAESLAAHVDQFQTAPLYARWEKFPPLAKWTRENKPALARIAGDVGQQLGVDVHDVWRRVFGQQTVLAIWPPQDADEKQGPGLLLVEAADADLLATLVAGVRDVQERSGELRQSRLVTYRGLEYEERLIERDGGKVHVYLAVLQRIGVLANHAGTIERVLDLHLAREATSASLSQLPAFHDAHAQVDASAPIKLFINPRSWDAALKRGMPAEGEPLGRGQQLLLQTWRTIKFVSLSLRLEPQVRLEGILALDAASEVTELPEVLGSLSGSPCIFEHIPADCLAAAAGNIDLARLIRWARKPADAPDPQAASRKRSAPEVLFSILDGTFQGVGPGFGAFISAAPQESQYPFSAAAGLQISSRLAQGAEPGGLKPMEALRSLLEAAAALQTGPDGQPPRVTLQKSRDLEVLTVGNLPEPSGRHRTFLRVSAASDARGDIAQRTSRVRDAGPRTFAGQLECLCAGCSARD